MKRWKKPVIMSFERYVWQGTRRLRCGYTTGSCAALAAGAACRMLLSQRTVDTAALTTPGGVGIEVPLIDPVWDASHARCAVRKDGGDDIDVTDGLLIYAEVRRTEAPGVTIEGGRGVGRVTRPGLDQPVGAAAINRIPRAMIRAAVAEACRCCGYTGGIVVTLEVPEGERVAARTFNPRLGIEGGISILGTSGIVEPRSLQALADTLALEIAQQAALGVRQLLLVPGNYGEDFVRAGRHWLPDWPVVTCANFVGQAVDGAVREGMAAVLLVGHTGKLVKVAGGVMDTHSHTADCRLELMAAHAAWLGAPQPVIRQLMEAATTEAGFSILQQVGLMEATSGRLLEAIEDHLARRAGDALQIGAVMFDHTHGLLGVGKHARRILEGRENG